MPVFDIRKRIYIAASIVVGLVIIFLFFFLFLRDRPVEEATPEQTPTQESEAGAGAATGTSDAVGSEKPSTPALPPEDNYVRQLARIFVERYGSYSNQNDNTHIVDVLPIVTDQMARWIQTQSIDQNGAYTGVTTKVVVSTIESISGANASVHIEAQELVETRDSRETQYRSGTVGLVFENGEWKISGLFWDE